MNTLSIMKAATFTPTSHGWGVPILWEGKPGVGKTSRIHELAKFGLHVEVLVGSVRAPTDIGGFPMPDNGTMKLIPPHFAEVVTKAKRAVIFADELNTSPPAVQAAFLRAMLEKVVGDTQLPGGVRWMAACNSVEDAAGGWDLAAPLANRLGHLQWDSPSADAWSQWMLADVDKKIVAEQSAEDIEDFVLAEWPVPWAKARGLVAGFIKRKPELLFRMPTAGDPNASKAWPSPRSWENAARALASSEVHELALPDQESFVAAFIGYGPAAEFLTWRKNADLPDPEDVLDGRVGFKHDKRRLDRTAAVVNSCAAFVCDEDCDNRNNRAAKLWEIMAGILDDGAPDLIVNPAMSLTMKGMSRVPSARKALAKIEPILRSAGIRG
jgi:hypothetical protein